MTEHNLIRGDSYKILKKFPSRSIHLAVTSPPYFNAREYAQWSTLKEYLEDMAKIFEQVFRTLDNHRVFVLNVGDVNCLMGKQPWTKQRIPLGSLFTNICREIGFEYVDNYIWDKGEPQSYRHMVGENKYPHYQYPINSYEHILIFHKHVLDKDRIPCPECGTTRVQNNSQSEIGVQSWECNNEECTHRSAGNRGKRYSARYIMMNSGKKEENKIEEEFSKKWRKDIVKFSPVIKMGRNGENRLGHTAPFPEDIPEMAVKFYSYVGDTILDPFAGSFTTSLVAVKNGRHSIGIDVKPEFIRIGNRRLKEFIKNQVNKNHNIIHLDENNLNKLQFRKSKIFDKEDYMKNIKFN